MGVYWDALASIPSDLIACWRLPDADPSFDTYIDYVKPGRYEVHCDLVFGFNASRSQVLTIGGNVSNSVRQKQWPIAENGPIGNIDPTNKDAKVVCIIDCRL